MASVFDEWTLEDARVAAQLGSAARGKLATYRAYYDGDHFQNWDGWTGFRPSSTDPNFSTMSLEIERGFVSRGMVREVIDRHVNGVLGRNVKWDVTLLRPLQDEETPTAEESVLIDEAKFLLEEWIDIRRLNQEYDQAGATLLYAGQAFQRCFVPPGELDDNGNIPAADLVTNINRIYAHYPQPGEATIYTDPRTQRQCSIYLYRESTTSRPSQAQNQNGQERAELTYIDGENTVIRIVGDGVNEEFRYQLGGRLLMSMLQRPAIINDQVISQQRLLNKTLSMKSRNMDMAGFRERVLLNAEVGGQLKTDSEGIERFVPDPIDVGAGLLLAVSGKVTTDSEGNERYASANMLWADPVPVDTFLATETSAEQAILAEVNQLHYAMADDAVASGVSRQTAMAAYLIDLLQTKQQVDRGWSTQLETVLALAAVLSNQAGRYVSLRVTAEASVDPGPISSEMIQTVINLWAAGKITLKTGLEWIGVEDAEGEIERLEKEQADAAESLGETQQMINTARAVLGQEL